MQRTESNNFTITIETEYIFCVGDIHGDFNAIAYNIKQYDMHNSTLIFCGDCGFGFNKQEYYRQEFKTIEKVCNERNCHCIFIRGNHDDPSYFNGYIELNTDHIHLIRDYTVIQFIKISDRLPLHNVLCIGGGVSVDRSMRIATTEKKAKEYLKYHKGIDFNTAITACSQLYWSDERPYFNKDVLTHITENNIKIDCVCTHTCPSFCEPVNKDGIKSWLETDKTLEEDLNKERKVMDDVYNFLIENEHPLTSWYYGHYHFHSFFTINEIKFYLLDMSWYGKFDMVEMY